MHISGFRIENHKSFRATDIVDLTPGFNVIVGQNNVGKTALVEALSLSAGQKAHRSLKALPTAATPLQGNSLVDVSFAISRSELIELLRSLQPQFWVPISEGSSPHEVVATFGHAIRQEVHSLRCTFQASSITHASLEGFQTHPQTSRCVLVDRR